jgi:hypothetical protein
MRINKPDPQSELTVATGRSSETPTAINIAITVARTVAYTRWRGFFRAPQGLLFLFTQRPLSTPFVYHRAHKSVIPTAAGQDDVWNFPHSHPAQDGFAMNLEMVGNLLDCQPRFRMAGDKWRIFAPQLTSNQNYRLHGSFRPSNPIPGPAQGSRAGL